MLVLDNTSAKPKAKLEVAWGGVTVRIKPPLRSNYVKYWEIIADNLKKRGWSWGYVSAVDSNGRTIWIVDAHRGGQRFIGRADEKLSAFLELESAIGACGRVEVFRQLKNDCENSRHSDMAPSIVQD